MLGLSIPDILTIILYFAVMIGIGIWASRRISNQEDYFLAGRRFGKWIQMFAAFGQATSADNAVGTTTTTFSNGIAGIWSSMLYLFATPLYWVCTHWPRRMRILTLGDYFEERFNSRKLGSVYAIIGTIGMMAFIGLGLSAMTKTILAITPKPALLFSTEDRQAYTESYDAAVQKSAFLNEPVSLLSYEELRLREDLEARDSQTLSDKDKLTLKTLRELRPAMAVSHLSKNMLIWMVCIVVLVYAALGGLEAAFITDMIQGVFIILLSFILIPFAWMKVNAMHGGSGFLDAMANLHQLLPDAMFKVFGAPHTPDFTWYYILSLSFMAAITVVVQPNGAVLAGSAKDELSSRAGTVMGNFLKRFCIIAWGLFALFAIVIYQNQVIHPDMIWGMATRDLLGSLNLGLVGLMIACLLAALMSTVDCLMLTCSSLLTHNLYAPLVPNKSQTHYVWAGRFFGIFVVLGGAGLALLFDTILQILKFIWEVNVMLAPAYWLGIKWRRANLKAAWTSVGLGGLLFLLLPLLLPSLFPSMRSAEALLKTTQPAPVTEVVTARTFDVELRKQEIDEWDQLDLHNQAPGRRPEQLLIGQSFSRTYSFPARGIFWSKGIQSVDGKPTGSGLFSTELWILQKIGVNVSNNPYALNETLRILFRTFVPFIIFIITALLSKPDPVDVLNRFYAKMRTRVIPDHAKDKLAVQASLDNPHHLDHQLLFPNSSWEIYRWNKEDWTGFLLSVMGVGIVLLVIIGLVNIGG